MKDVIYEGRWRRSNFKEGDTPVFVLLPQGDLHSIEVKTEGPCSMVIVTPRGQIERLFSPGGEESATITISERFSKNSEIAIIPDLDDDVLTRVSFYFEERLSLFGL